MIRIVDSKRETKKYINAVTTFFKLYRMNESISQSLPGAKEFFKIISAIKGDELYENEPLKKQIIKMHLLEDEPLPAVARKLGYSPSHVYNINQSIVKEFAMLIFEVIIL